MEQWLMATKKADFYGLAKELEIDPVTVRLLRNRGLITEKEMRQYLSPSLEHLYSPHLMKDMDKAVSLIRYHIHEGNKIMIANDFDCDGISSGYILEQGFLRCGADVYVDTPDRCKDGYGINERLVEEAHEQGVKLIVTCDNGIAAREAIALASSLGIEVIVTDHHEVPMEENEIGEKTYLLPCAQAIVNPKQIDCAYPFKGLCGAGVALKLIMVLDEQEDRNPSAALDFLEIAAMATIADVMELKDENRIIVSCGLAQMKKTKNLGLHALMDVNKIDSSKLSAYHIGFVIGPCLNASGRLDTAKKALDLLKAEDNAAAYQMAEELKGLNESRKSMTLTATEQAIEKIEQSSLKGDDVLVVDLEHCHESLAGIIAGRLREHYYRPAIVLVETENGMKGSGRSIPTYNIFEKVNQSKNLLTRFGGHPMACGLSIPKENIEQFRQELNEHAKLTKKDLTPIVSIDLALPPEYLNENLILEFNRLEPFGNGNSRPLFAGKGFKVESAKVLGVKGNVLKMQLITDSGYRVLGIYFGEVEEFLHKIEEHFGKTEYEQMMNEKENQIRLLLAFYPQINEFRGIKTLQLVIQHYDFPKDFILQ